MRGIHWVGVVVVVAVCAGVISACASSPRQSQTALSYNVLLVPPVYSGEAGWCMVVAHSGCMGGKSSGNLIVGESWHSYGPPSRRVGVVVTTSAVSAVSVEGGHPVLTRAETGLSDGMRVAAIEIKGGRARLVRAFGISVPPGAPPFMPLNRFGRPMFRSTAERRPLIFLRPSRKWVAPTLPGGGVCSIRASGLPGLRAKEGFVVISAAPQTDTVAHALLSCASTSYSVGGSMVVGSVLVDASHPGSNPTLPPTMTPVAGQPGFFEGPVAEGEGVVRHVRGAWVMVSGGTGVSQRLLVLKHLHAGYDAGEGKNLESH